MKNCETSKEEKLLMMQWEQGHPDSERLQELLLKLDAINFVDVPSVAHGPEYKTGMGQHVNKPSVSNTNYIKRDQEESSGFVMPDLDPMEAADLTSLISSDLPCMSEIYGQSTCDGVPADAPDSGVELDEDHVGHFEYEVESDSESDFDHEKYDDDGQPVVDEDDDPLLPWPQGVDYTEGQFSYLTAFASTYREARKA